jgi:hypothetical protein
MTNFIQPIDAGLGRSFRILIGHFLHAWLMEADHMEKWESKMTAGERRILSIGFLGKAMRKVMHRAPSVHSSQSHIIHDPTIEG